MFEVFLTDRGRMQSIDQGDSLESLVNGLRDMWNEDDGPQTFVIQDPIGAVMAVLMRLDGDPELCRTVYSDGRVELHRCHYVVDSDDCYDRTEVTAIPAASPADRA